MKQKHRIEWDGYEGFFIAFVFVGILQVVQMGIIAYLLYLLS